MTSKIYGFFLKHLDTLHSLVFNLARPWGYLRLPTYSLAFRYGLSTISAGLWYARVGKMGKGVRIDSGVIIRGKPKNLEIGDHCYINANVVLNVNGPIKMGKYVEIANQSILHCTRSGITLGDCVTISAGVRIFTSTNALWMIDENTKEDLLKTIDFTPPVLGIAKNAPVIIHDYAFIGANSVVLAGVEIGKGAIIGANSVVTKDIPPLATASGVPARIFRDRAEPGEKERR